METVKNPDTMEIPGPQSIETFALLHGKQDTTSKQAKLDQLFADFRNKVNSLVALQENAPK